MNSLPFSNVRYLGAPLTWKDPPTASWPGLQILHCPSLLEQRVAPKGLPSKSSYLRPIPVNFSHQTRCCSFVSVTSPLQPPSLRHAAQLRWGVIFLQKCEGKSLAFTIFCNLRRGGEGLQQCWGHLCGALNPILAFFSQNHAEIKMQ